MAATGWIPATTSAGPSIACDPPPWCASATPIRRFTQAVSWGLRNRVGLVACSDTTRDDEPRHWIKEALKKRIVSAFGAVLVAGGRAASYMDSLGIGK